MRLFLFFTLFPLLLAAQPGAGKQTNRSWSAEIEQDWQLDFPTFAAEEAAGVSTLKLLRADLSKGFGSSIFLAELVYNEMGLDRMAIFEDPDCSIPTTWDKVFRSQAVTIDPETGEEKVVIGCLDINPSETFKNWRVRQILSYREKDVVWQGTLKAVAPLMELRNNNGDSIGMKPLFWFRPGNTRPALTDPDIVWAKKTVNTQTKTLVPITRISPMAAGDTLPPLLNHLREVVEQRLNIPVYKSNSREMYTAEERRTLITRTDTATYCFSGGPNGESFFVVHFDRFEAVHYLQLEQSWYWDQRRRRLSICLDAVAPLQDRYTNEGDFRDRKPMFIMRPKP